MARLTAEYLRTRRTYMGQLMPRCRAPRGFEIFHGRAEREAKSLIKNRLRLASTARRKAIVTFPRPYSDSRRQINQSRAKDRLISLRKVGPLSCEYSQPYNSERSAASTESRSDLFESTAGSELREKWRRVSDRRERVMPPAANTIFSQKIK